MKIAWSNTAALFAGLALVLISNAVALSGVAYNRTGDPESEMKLTERELSIANWGWPESDKSSIDLQLRWRVQERQSRSVGDRYENFEWMDREQARALGFDLSRPVESEDDLRRYANALPKEVFLVLEYDGPAHQAALELSRERLRQATDLATTNADKTEFKERLESAREDLERQEQFASRLFVVDASLDSNALRTSYPDRKRYAIVRGRLSLMIVGEAGRRYLIVGQPDIDIETISVPHAFRSVVEPLMRQDRYSGYLATPSVRRFAATVRFGSRLEPWISELQEM